MRQEIIDLRLRGYCCSQIIVEMGLARLDKENPDLISAMAGLCEGLWSGKTCGVLSGAICLLYLADPKQAASSHVIELTDWFEASFNSADCDDLLEANPLNKIEKCPMMIDATFTKIEELLEWDE
ncbi:MAG: C-GCAxxG-C-C family protein [Anaerovoracaceae bacterium]